MLTVRNVEFFACGEHGQVAFRGWPSAQAWPHVRVLRQELSVCLILASRASSGRARPTASGSVWARACGQVRARGGRACIFSLCVGPPAGRALGARGAWRGGTIRSTKEHQRPRRHSAPRKEHFVDQPSSVADGHWAVPTTDNAFLRPRQRLQATNQASRPPTRAKINF